jgi:hypothetical protein
MFDLKPLSRDAIPAALQKAEQYRLLNQPGAAESICLDIVAVEHEHQLAWRTLLLARTDQFPADASAVRRAREALEHLESAYERAYYAGLIAERRAKALLDQRTPAPGSRFMAYDELREAMSSYEQAEPLRPPGDDDAILRWNTCARLLESSPHLVPRPDERTEPVLGE